MNFSCRRIISVVFCVCALLLYIGMHNCQSLKQVNSWETSSDRLHAFDETCSII